MYKDAGRIIDKQAILKFAFNQDKKYINQPHNNKSNYIIEEKNVTCNFPILYFNLKQQPPVKKVTYLTSNLNFLKSTSNPNKCTEDIVVSSIQKPITSLEQKGRNYKILHKKLSKSMHVGQQEQQLLREVKICTFQCDKEFQLI